MPWLINPAQLAKFQKHQKNVVVFDATWHRPQSQRNAYAEYVNAHISGARFFDITMFHDATSVLPNQLLLDEVSVAASLGALGITNQHKIIFYDQSDCYTSCRAAWMMKVFGHSPFQLYILDGGLAAWQQSGGKLVAGESSAVTSKSYRVNIQPQYVRTLAQMKANVQHPIEQVIDMRDPMRFAGGSEYRVGLRQGHIPGSFCFPYQTMIDKSGRFKSLKAISQQLTSIGVSLTHPIISTCGSGVTAAVLDVVLDLLDHPTHALYDGSWSEWGADILYVGEISLAERPIVTSFDEVSNDA